MAQARSELIHPVILCGGSGTRLWPASRESMPKQFTPLVNAESSTFQDTARRVLDASVFGRPTIISNSEARFIVAEQLLQAGVQADIVLEPERRDSAAAVAVAALHAARRDPQAVVLILAADHVIGDAPAFVAAAQAAAIGARAGRIMTLGIEPTGPATAYGYIRRGARLDGVPGAYAVERFVEKPDRDGAERLIGEGALWNSGYFLFRADVMLAELEARAPEILSATRAAHDTPQVDRDIQRRDGSAVSRAPRHRSITP